jgi:hypothetical protein
LDLYVRWSGPDTDEVTEDEIRADARQAVAEDIAAGRIPPEPSPEAQDRLNRVLLAAPPAKPLKRPA